MKVIEEPAFMLENSIGFDTLVEHEMETLEGGCLLQVTCSGQCIGQSGGSGGSSGGTTTTTTTTTPAA